MSTKSLSLSHVLIPSPPPEKRVARRTRMQSVEQTLRDLHSRLEELDSAVDNGEIEFTGLHKLEK